MAHDCIENTISNQNDGSNYNLVCVSCGCQDLIHMVAHRNQHGRICGFLISCSHCSKDLADKKVFIQSEET